MNWHQVIDERNYEMDQVIASILRQDPSKLERVLAWIKTRLADPDYAIQSKDSLQEWLDLIEKRGVSGVLEVLIDRSENSVRMRQCSPFAIIMPQDQRMKILRRYESLRTRTHSADDATARLGTAPHSAHQ